MIYMLRSRILLQLSVLRLGQLWTYLLYDLFDALARVFQRSVLSQLMLECGRASMKKERTSLIFLSFVAWAWAALGRESLS